MGASKLFNERNVRIAGKNRNTGRFASKLSFVRSLRTFVLEVSGALSIIVFISFSKIVVPLISRNW